MTLKQKWIKIVAVICICLLAFGIYRSSHFYRTVYNGYYEYAKRDGFSDYVDVHIRNIEKYLDEDAPATSSFLAVLLENLQGCMVTLIDLQNFCTFAKDKPLIKIDGNIISETEKITIRRSETCNQLYESFNVYYFELHGWLKDKNYIENEKEFRAFMENSLKEWKALKDILENNDFSEVNNDGELLSCYIGFLNEAYIMSLDFLKE